MELLFEQTTNLGTGVTPAAIHMADGSIWLFNVTDGRLKAKTWQPNTGDVEWDLPNFEDEIIATSDKSVSLYRLKNVPRVGMFGAWHQNEVTIGGKLLSPERHRFGIWDALNDLTNYLESGSIQMDLDNIISTASFTFKNPFHHLSGETTSMVLPGKKIELFFTAGDSEDYPMGVYYADRVTMESRGETVTVECRNISGKLLKDQMLNADYNYPKDVYAYVVEDFLTAAGITDFDIQQPPDPLTAWQLGMTFSPDTDRLTALNTLIAASLNWVIRETLDGEIVAGSAVSYTPIINMNGTYEFDRSDLISRKVERDDSEVYSRVCFQSTNSSTGVVTREYAAVEHAFEWPVAFHKTLYVATAEDTPQSELEELAAELASRMSFAGVVETFSGPFRPHLTPGDEAIVTGVDNHLAGIITTVIHNFGEEGFTTEFVVDSSGEKGKPRLLDMINPKNNTATGARRLY